MSDFDLFSYINPPSPLKNEEDLSIGQSQVLVPLPNSFERHCSTGAESIGSSSTSNDYSSLGRPNHDVLEPERQLPSTVWVEDEQLVESPGPSFFASKVKLDLPKPLDGQIPVNDTMSANVSESPDSEDDFDADMYPNNFSDDSAEISSTPVRRRPAPLSAKPRKRLISHSSSIASSDESDYAKKPPPPSLKNRTAVRNKANSTRTARIKALDKSKDAVVPLDKKQKGRMTFNSACAADDLSLFAPDHNANSTSPMIASAPHSSDCSVSDTSSLSPDSEVVTMTKKRKLEDTADISIGKEREESGWEPIHESYSRRRINDKSQYRCNLCLEDDEKVHLCSREGDMTRHLQSLAHTPKSFFCTNSECTNTYTRQDALKRHLKKCRA